MGCLASRAVIGANKRERNDGRQGEDPKSRARRNGKGAATGGEADRTKTSEDQI